MQQNATTAEALSHADSLRRGPGPLCGWLEGRGGEGKWWKGAVRKMREGKLEQDRRLAKAGRE